MRVLHVLSSNVFSGAENVVCQIVHMFGACENVNMIYCSPNGEIREALKERKVEFYPLRTLSIKELKRAIGDVKPDIIHAHDMRASVYCSIVCGKIKLISHIHNNSFESRKPSVKAILYAIQAHKYSHIFWVSQSAKNGYYFQKAISNKSSVLRNLIDIEETKKRASQAELRKKYDIVYVGRMSYPKNPQRLIEVITDIIGRNPYIKVGIAGNGELYNEVKQLVEENNIVNNIDLLGFVSNPYGIIQNAKLMLMTSRWEGTPMCALEAMALGTPIVSTPTDGLKDLIDEGNTGFLCESDEKLVESCLKIIDDKELEDELSKKSKERAADLMNINNYRRAILEQYEDKN